MKFKSLLEKLGQDAKKVFAWVASSQGQAVIGTGEVVVETVAPELTGIINLANTYIKEAVTTETLAMAAGSQNGSGVQKAAAVTTAVTPAVLAYAQKAGIPQPTADQIKKATDGIVAFLNAFAAEAPQKEASAQSAS